MTTQQRQPDPANTVIVANLPAFQAWIRREFPALAAVPIRATLPRDADRETVPGTILITANQTAREMLWLASDYAECWLVGCVNPFPPNPTLADLDAAGCGVDRYTVTAIA